MTIDVLVGTKMANWMAYVNGAKKNSVDEVPGSEYTICGPCK